MNIKVKLLNERAEVPHFAHSDDACFDMRIYINREESMPMVYFQQQDAFIPAPGVMVADDVVCINPNQTVIFHTHLAFEIPVGYNMKMHVRSSIGIKKNIILSNATGVIDAGYRGEVRIALTNIGNNPVCLRDKDKVCQCEVVKTFDYDLVESDDLTDTERGSGGIGSTGR